MAKYRRDYSAGSFPDEKLPDNPHILFEKAVMISGNDLVRPMFNNRLKIKANKSQYS